MSLQSAFVGAIPILPPPGVEDVRLQNPKLERTSPDEAIARWFIRPRVPELRDGRIVSVKRRIYLGACAQMDKRAAMKARSDVLAKINRHQVQPASRQSFGSFLDDYIAGHVSRMAASTQAKYRDHIENHIRPAFGDLAMCDVSTRLIETLLAAKAKPRVKDGKTIPGLSTATLADLKNIISGAFTTAERWGLWEGKNPARHAQVGRHVPAREQRKLTVDQTRKLLSALPDDVRQIVMVALFCTLRISEVLGLQWKHVDFERGALLVRQRWYRGDLDAAKSRRAIRDVPMGMLADELRRRGPGDPDDFVFSVRTYGGKRETRDDRSINQHFLRPTAKALGIYWRGFGFHAFRREAITGIAAETDALQAARQAGHSDMRTTLLYSLADFERQDAAARRRQQVILGMPSKGGVN